MVLWRISNYADLDGDGGLIADGRWHQRGSPIVYCADHPALALVEVLVHLDYDLIPTTYQWLRIEAPQRLSVTAIDQIPAEEEACRTLGQKWLDGRQTALLSVPSAVVPAARNFLLNPLHADHSKFEIVARIRWPLVPRLINA